MTGASSGGLVGRAPGTVTELFGDEAVVWLESAQTLHHLDAAGSLIWSCLELPGTPDEVASRVAEQVDGPGETVRRDVHDFLATMLDRSLVVSG